MLAQIVGISTLECMYVCGICDFFGVQVCAQVRPSVCERKCVNEQVCALSLFLTKLGTNMVVRKI